VQIPGSIPMPYATAADSNSGSSSGSQDDGTITANDFLTLLVTELKNQDPTANTDPNAYVDQLVQVNSLQQLIQINQNTTSTTGSAPSSNSGS
jgi:flagellar basal-body rod modification protein FlgD